MKGRVRLTTLAAVATLTWMTSAAGAVGSRGCRSARLRPSRSNVAAIAGATLCVINQIRRSHHLRPFRVNAVLRSIAAGQSDEMLAGGYFGDDSRSGRTPFQRVAASAYGRHRKRLSVGQNIAWGDAGQSTPAVIVQAWMASPPHRAILLAPAYEDVGVGVGLGTPRRSDRRSGATYTVDLAARGS